MYPTNSCYTYFKIVGNFNPDDVSALDVIDFCHATRTEMDIDLYLYNKD